LFSLNSSGYGQTAKLIGNMVIQDLKAVCGAIEAGPGRRRPGPASIAPQTALRSWITMLPISFAVWP